MKKYYIVAKFEDTLNNTKGVVNGTFSIETDLPSIEDIKAAENMLKDAINKENGKANIRCFIIVSMIEILA